MIVEGVLAETGYHAFFTMLQRNSLMPGLLKGISLLKQDESRHIAYGVYLLSRLVGEHPEQWETLDAQMNSLLPYAIGVIGDAFGGYEVVPFGLVEDDFVDFAMSQFARRFERLAKARGASREEIEIIVFSSGYRSVLDGHLVRHVLDLKTRGVQVLEMATFYKKVTGKVPVRYIEDAWLLFGLPGDR